MSFLGNLFSPLSGNQKQSNNLLNYNAQNATNLSNNATGEGNSDLSTGLGFLGNAQNGLGQAGSYFSNLLSGNSAATTSALAPDISRINDQNNNLLTAGSTLAPRGGGRSSQLFEQPFRAQSQISGLYNGVRPQAAQGLTQLSGVQGQLGLGEAGLGTNLLNTGINALQAGTNAASAFGSSANSQKQQQNAAGMAGGLGIASLLSSIPGLVTSLGAAGGGGFGGLYGGYSPAGL